MTPPLGLASKMKARISPPCGAVRCFLLLLILALAYRSTWLIPDRTEWKSMTTTSAETPRDWHYNKSLLLLQEDDTPRNYKKTLLIEEDGTPRPPAERAIAFSLIGAQKSGTTAMGAYLVQHPNILGRTYGFFLWNAYQNAENSLPKLAYPFTGNLTTKDWTINQTTSMIGYDNTPDNLLRSMMIPSRFREICPTGKVLVQLRDPVDRAYSDFSMELHRQQNFNTSFEKFIEKDFQRLKEAGVIQGYRWDNETEFQAFSGSKEEDKAWERYTRHSGDNPQAYFPVGRGLYSIQLRHWFKEYDKMPGGRDLFLISEYKELYERGGQAAFDRVIKFLDLAPYELNNVAKQRVGKYEEPIDPKMRQRLEDFYAPYNRQLQEILGEEWKGIWEKTDA
jgi:hypothetical protein